MPGVAPVNCPALTTQDEAMLGRMRSLGPPRIVPALTTQDEAMLSPGMICPRRSVPALTTALEAMPDAGVINCVATRLPDIGSGHPESAAAPPINGDAPAANPAFDV